MFVERARRRALVAGALTLTLVLASCGAIEDAIGGDDTEETVEAIETTTTTAVPVFEADAYCALSHRADVINAEFTAFDDPALLEGFFTSLTGLLNQAVAPPEIEPQFTTFRTAYVDLQAQLEAGAYSIEVLQASPILSDANVNAAITAVDEHDLALCGVAPGLPEEAAPEPEPAETDPGVGASNPFSAALASGDFTAVEELLGTEVGRQAFIEGFVNTSPAITEEQAGCFLDNSDIEVLAAMSVDPDNLSDEAVQSFLATLETCDIPLSAFQNQ